MPRISSWRPTSRDSRRQRGDQAGEKAPVERAGGERPGRRRRIIAEATGSLLHLGLETA
jgi:hypothetical protein